MDWIAALRELPEDALWVQHRPLTPRYVRAAAKLPALLRSAALLGTRPAENPEHTELATWSPPPDGRGVGAYCCFRAYGARVGPLRAAALFCFYDGRDQSPGFRTLSSAQTFARDAGFLGAT